MRKAGIAILLFFYLGTVRLYSQNPDIRKDVFFIRGFDDTGAGISRGAGVFIRGNYGIALVKSFRGISSFQLFTIDSVNIIPQKITGYDEATGLIRFSFLVNGKNSIPGALLSNDPLNDKSDVTVVRAGSINRRELIQVNPIPGKDIPGYGQFRTIKNDDKSSPDGSPVFNEDNSLYGITLSGLGKSPGIDLLLLSSWFQRMKPVDFDFAEFIKTAGKEWNNYFDNAIFSFGLDDLNNAYNNFQFSSGRLKNNFTLNACLGIIYSSRRDYAKAIGYFDRALESEPGNREVPGLRGSTRVEAGNFKEAIPDLDRAVSLGDSSAGIYYDLGYCHLQTGSYDNAAAAFNKSIHSGNKDPMAWYYLGVAYYNLKKDREAMLALESALERGADSARVNPVLATEYYNTRDYDKALEIVSKELASDSTNSSLWILSGKSKLKTGRISPALQDLDRAYALASNDTSVVISLADVYNNIDSLKKAVQYYEIGISLGADYAGTNNKSGEGQLRNGNMAEARKHFERAIELAPSWHLPILNLASLEFRANDEQKATENLDKARQLGADENMILEIRGIANYELGKKDASLFDLAKACAAGKITNPQAWYYLADLQSGNKQFEAALDNLDRAINAGYENPKTLSLRGIVKYNLRNFSGCISDLSYAIQSGYARPDLFYYRGMAYFILQEYILAEKDLGFYASSSNADSLVFKNLGIISAASTNYQEAVQYFTKAIESGYNQAEMYNRRGMANIAIKQFSRAIEDFSMAISLNAGYEEAYYNRGIAKDSIGDSAGSKEDIRRALDISQAQRTIFVFQGYDRYNAGDFAGAVDQFQRARSMGIESGKVYYGLGNAHFNLGNYVLAIQELDKAVALGEFSRLLFTNRGKSKYYLKNYEAAVSDFIKATDLGSNDPDIYRFLGLCYYDRNDFKKSLEEYSQAIKIRDDFKEAFANRGDCWLSLKNYLSAIADYDTAILLGTRDPVVYNNRGKAYMMLAQYESAISSFNSAIEINPGYINAMENRAGARFKSSDFEGCLRDCEYLDSKNKADANTYYLMGESAYGLKNFGKAETLFQEAINRGITTKEVYFSKGMCNIENKVWNRAVNDFTMVILKDDKDPHAYNLRAQSYIGLGEYELAKTDLNQALIYDKTDPDIYFNRALIYENYRDYDRAILDYTRILKVHPDDHYVYYSRGRARLIMGEYVPALNDLDKALTINSSIPEYFRMRGDIKYQINQLIADPCSDWNTAVQLGDKRASFSIKKYCR
jgi:tetratricopeptide (TPR) repeat protein